MEMITQRKQLALERVIAIVADKLLKTGGESLSVSEIAAAARCSTSTIYEAFRSKDGLLDHVFRRLNEDDAIPAAREADPDYALEGLVDFLTRRIAYFGRRHTVAVMRAIALHSNRDNDDLQHHFEARDPSLKAVSLVSTAIEAGMIAPNDPYRTAYVIVSSVSFEPMMTGLLLDERVDAPALLRTVLTPHLTPEGAERLKAMLPSGKPVELERVVGAHRLAGLDKGLRD